jgi:hypothetical protein
MWWIVGVVAAIMLVATYITWTASRVDRLHARAAAARSALEAHLIRRAAAVTGLAEALHRPSLREAARAALEAYPEERESAENDLTRALRSLPGPAGPGVGESFAEVVAASRRMALTRQVHNDLVRDALTQRRRRLVRVLRLARKYPQPTYFDVDEPILVEPTAV